MVLISRFEWSSVSGERKGDVAAQARALPGAPLSHRPGVMKGNVRNPGGPAEGEPYRFRQLEEAAQCERGSGTSSRGRLTRMLLRLDNQNVVVLGGARRGGWAIDGRDRNTLVCCCGWQWAWRRTDVC